MFIPEISDNQLFEKIKEIIEIAIDLEEETYFEFSDASTNDEINEWQQKNGIIIPDSYKNWLLFSNGSVIDSTRAEFYGLDRIKAAPAAFPSDYVIIGTLVGDGEVLYFSKNNLKIYSDNHGKTKEYVVFDNVLEMLIAELNNY